MYGPMWPFYCGQRDTPGFGASHIKNGLNKFLALLSRTEKFLSGSTKSLAYTDHII